MLLPTDVFEWLRAEAAVESVRPSGGMVELPAEAADAVMSGQLVARVLLKPELGLGAGTAAADEQLLELLASISTQRRGARNVPSERLYAWGVLSSVLARLGFNLSTDDKTLIVAGDQEGCRL